MQEPLVKGLIQYYGICRDIPSDIRSFKTQNFHSTVTIDESCPEIDEISKVRATGNIDEFRVIKTAVGTSIDGQELTGWKLIVHGKLKVQLDYSSFKNGPSVYVTTVYVDFDSFITLPKNTYITSRIRPNVFIEDLYVDNLENHEVFINYTVILTADVD